LPHLVAKGLELFAFARFPNHRLDLIDRRGPGLNRFGVIAPIVIAGNEFFICDWLTRNLLPSGQSTGSEGTIFPFFQVAMIGFIVHLLRRDHNGNRIGKYFNERLSSIFAGVAGTPRLFCRLQGTTQGTLQQIDIWMTTYPIQVI
jgi:hypothetical protein